MAALARWAFLMSLILALALAPRAHKNKQDGSCERERQAGPQHGGAGERAACPALGSCRTTVIGLREKGGETRRKKNRRRERHAVWFVGSVTVDGVLIESQVS